MNSGYGALAAVAIHTVAIYVFLIATLRLGNRRQLGQLTVLDLVIVILLGSAVETAMVAGNTTLPAGIISAATLLLCNRILATLALRYKRVGRFVNHGPVLLVHDGQFVDENLKRMGLTHADVMEALREREICEVKDAKFAVLEPDGEIDVIAHDVRVHRSRRSAGAGGHPEPLDSHDGNAEQAGA